MKIILPFAAYSINDQYYADRKFGMRKEAKDFCYKVNWELDKRADDFLAFNKTFDKKHNALRIKITHYYANFYNKSGEISSKVLDLSNSEKLLLDLLLDPRNHGTAPYKCRNLNINDKYVVELISKKCPGSEDLVELEIEMLKL
jgi:hypothetical protein